MGKMIEVDEDQWNQNQRLRERLARIAAKPANRAALERMEKEIDPNVATPFADEEKARLAPVEELRKEVKDTLKEIADERAKEREEREKVLRDSEWEAGRKYMLDRGFTVEGVDKIEKELMAARGIARHEDAAKIWEAEHPAPPPSMPGGTGAWNFLDQPEDKSNESIKKLIDSKGQDNLVADRMARDALNEFRQQVAQSSGRR